MHPCSCCHISQAWDHTPGAGSWILVTIDNIFIALIDKNKHTLTHVTGEYFSLVVNQGQEDIAIDKDWLNIV